MSEEAEPTWTSRVYGWAEIALYIYLVFMLLRSFGPVTPRLWHAIMVTCQRVASGFGQGAIVAELAYREAVEKTSLT